MLNHKYEITDETAALRSELDRLVAKYDQCKNGLDRSQVRHALDDVARFWDAHRSQVRFIVYDEPLPDGFDQVAIGKLEGSARDE